MLTALDAGASDVVTLENSYFITTPADKFIAVKDALVAMGVAEFLTCEVSFVPSNEMEVDEETKEKVNHLIEQLEDLDDVQDVYHNLKEDIN